MNAKFLEFFLFGIYPYICLTAFILGSILRYDRDQFTWKADSSQLMRKKGMRIGSNLFHVGILVLFFGHFVGLLTPHWVYEVFITSSSKLIMAMVVGGIAGTACFIGMSILIWRRLFDPRIRATSKPMDIAILLIIYVQLILGLLTIPESAKHLSGESMLALAEWAQRIVTFRGNAADYVTHAAWVFKLHLVLGMTLFLIFPFTRLVHAWSGFAAPIKYLSRSGYQVVRKRG
jgi:nitrate reductase gamma subunit